MTPFQSLIRIFLLVLCFSLPAMGIFSKRGLLDWQRMLHQNEDLSQKIAVLQIEKEKWEIQTHTLATDVNEQERVVRQSLGYVMPTEVVIEFE